MRKRQFMKLPRAWKFESYLHQWIRRVIWCTFGFV